MQKSFIKRSKNYIGSLLGLNFLFSTPLFAEVASTAAQATTKSPASGEPTSAMMGQILMLAAFGFIFYFLIWRPQSKRAKQQRDLITSLQKGDEVITAGGILGKIQRVKDDFLVLVISEGTEVLVQKQAIAGTLPKGTMKDI